MYSVGIDLVEIARIRKGCENKRFIDRVFSPAEKELFCGERMRYDSLAGNWAAKEAFSKALGTGVRDFLLTEVEILRDELGAPYIRLTGNAACRAAERGLCFSVSITHTKELAQAIVIGWKEI